MTSSYTTLHNRLAQTKEEGFLSWEEFKEGPDHAAVWTLQLKFKGEVKGVGKGMTKSQAKEEAAKEACKVSTAAELHYDDGVADIWFMIISRIWGLPN